MKEIQRRFPKSEQYDGNMRMAATLSYVLGFWYSRLHRAKCYDPRRPVRLRKAAYFQRYSWALAMFNALLDESDDCDMFKQKWETPFDPFPTDGYFV